MKTPAIVYYISGHGFGHATRSVEVINRLRAVRPEVPIHIRSWASKQIFDEMCPGVPVANGQFDIGVVQADGISMDIEATLKRCTEILDQADSKVDDELAWLKTLPAGCIVSDIPPIAHTVASKMGIPCLTVTNFTWDWIYDGWSQTYPHVQPLVNRMFDQYALSDCLLRLPYAGDLPAFRCVKDMPMLGRKAELDAATTRQRLGLDAESRLLVLLSFGGMGFQSGSLDGLSALDDYCLLTTFPVEHPSVHHLPPLLQKGVSYPDLVKAVDVVVTKPGYGIVSECAVNHTRMVYTDRGPFREYDMILEEFPYWNCAEYVERSRLRRGDFRDALDNVMTRDPADVPGAAEAARANGAAAVANEVLAYYDRGR